MPTGGHNVGVRGSRGARVLRVCDEGNGVYRVDYIVRLQRLSLLSASPEHLRLADAVARLLTFQQQQASTSLVQKCMVHLQGFRA